MNSMSMSVSEIRAAVGLAMVFFLRMLPLFMVLPVLAMADKDYSHTTPQLLGLALGINGLTQACLQIPFGMLSDRFGRKPLIIFGLLMFIFGSLIAAIGDTISGLIFGRALQGAGAVSAASMALAADLSREETRTRVMALIGISIGLAFPIAFILGPLLYSHIGMHGLFFLSCGFGCLAIMLLLFVVPKPAQTHSIKAIHLTDVLTILKTPYLLKLDISIFLSHMILMANFLVIPIAFRDVAQLDTSVHWQVYLLILFVSLFITIPLIMFGDKWNKVVLFFGCSVILILTSQLGLYMLNQQLIPIVVSLILFFGAFNYLEALLPSEVSKTISADKKGTALGIFSAAQFTGIFTGGLLGGIMQELGGMTYTYLLSLLSSVIWLGLLVIIPNRSCDCKKYA